MTTEPTRPSGERDWTTPEGLAELNRRCEFGGMSSYAEVNECISAIPKLIAEIARLQTPSLYNSLLTAESYRAIAERQVNALREERDIAESQLCEETASHVECAEILKQKCAELTALRQRLADAPVAYATWHDDGIGVQHDIYAEESLALKESKLSHKRGSVVVRVRILRDPSPTASEPK